MTYVCGTAHKYVEFCHICRDFVIGDQATIHYQTILVSNNRYANSSMYLCYIVKIFCNHDEQNVTKKIDLIRGARHPILHSSSDESPSRVIQINILFTFGRIVFSYLLCLNVVAAKSFQQNTRHRRPCVSLSSHVCYIRIHRGGQIIHSYMQFVKIKLKRPQLSNQMCQFCSRQQKTE